MNENGVSLKQTWEESEKLLPHLPHAPSPAFPRCPGAADHHPTWGGVPSHLSFPSSPSPIKTVILESDLTDYFLPLRESSITKGGGGGWAGSDGQDFSPQK